MARAIPAALVLDTLPLFVGFTVDCLSMCLGGAAASSSLRAKRSNPGGRRAPHRPLDCFVASLLARTNRPSHISGLPSGIGIPTRMRREKSGDRSAAFARSLMRARSMSSASGIEVSTAPRS